MSRKSHFQSKNLNDTHDLMTFMTPAKKTWQKFGGLENIY